MVKFPEEGEEKKSRVLSSHVKQEAHRFIASLLQSTCVKSFNAEITTTRP